MLLFRKGRLLHSIPKQKCWSLNCSLNCKVSPTFFLLLPLFQLYKSDTWSLAAALLQSVLDCTLPSAAIIYFVMCLLVPAEPGKFDLVYQNPDGSEIVEYAVTHGSQVLNALLNVTLKELVTQK